MSKTEYQDKLDRAAFQLDIEKMSIKEDIESLRPKCKGKRFPAIVIDKWNRRADKANLKLFDWIKLQIVEETNKSESIHEKNQRPIQEVFGIKK
jgi:phosphorylcholine metabolism protein LicD